MENLGESDKVDVSLIDVWIKLTMLSLSTLLVMLQIILDVGHFLIVDFEDLVKPKSNVLVEGHLFFGG